ncbi:MAG: hypothetical protein Tsb0021_10890 [Chlamydiales bacterium]
MHIVTLHVLATWLMVGVIWIVQCVHYPLFKAIPSESFKIYHQQHMKKISFVVVPPMILELGTGIWLAIPLNPFFNPVFLSALIPLILIWIVTFLKMVKLHHRLSQGGDGKDIDSLVVWNTVRTALWTLRGVLFFFFGTYEVTWHLGQKWVPL